MYTGLFKGSKWTRNCNGEFRSSKKTTLVPAGLFQLGIVAGFLFPPDLQRVEPAYHASCTRTLSFAHRRLHGSRDATEISRGGSGIGRAGHGTALELYQMNLRIY